ncbi:MAG: hypothetical protein RLZZ174_590 [Pseudomonadota bacterium]|jgi:uncharacterized membrane protein YecN with MAPEG domain
MTDPTLFIPHFAAATTGAIVLLNIILMILVGRQRGATQTSLGDGDVDGPLYRAIRSHGNLAENAGLMLVALALLEALTGPTAYVQGLCGLFVVARLAHPLGLSGGIMALRVLGALGTMIVGVGVGILLLQATLFA